MELKEFAKRLEKAMSDKGYSAYKLSKLTGVSQSTIGRWLKGESEPQLGQLSLISDKLDVSKDYLLLNESNEDIFNEDKPDYKKKIRTKKNRVPVYEIDVTSSIVSSFSDIKEIPSFYMDYEPFNDCDAVVTNYGDSMYPDYKNGERLAVKKIVNFDVLNWGETYLVITDAEANDLKTVKRLHPHEDNDKIILRAGNPRYAGDTVIFKTNVLALFAVKGKVSQNFI